MFSKNDDLNSEVISKAESVLSQKQAVVLMETLEKVTKTIDTMEKRVDTLSSVTVPPKQAAVLFKALEDLTERFDAFEKTLSEQEFRRQNPPTYVEEVNAILLPTLKEYVWMLFTGFFGLHHFSTDFSLAIMCCVFPGVFWMFDIVTFYIHRQHVWWKYVRIFYTIVFYCLCLVSYVSIQPLQPKLPSPEITTFFVLCISNAIGYRTFFLASLMFRMLPRNEYFSVACFLFVYYCEFTENTHKLNDFRPFVKKVWYAVAMVLSIGFYKNALLDRETHLKVHQMFRELMDAFSYSFQTANQEIKNNIVEMKYDLYNL